jgi:hypothetical protein
MEQIFDKVRRNWSGVLFYTLLILKERVLLIEYVINIKRARLK